MIFIADYYKYFALVVLLISLFKNNYQLVFKNVLAVMNILILLNTFIFLKTSWELYEAFQQLHFSNSKYNWLDSFYLGKQTVFLIIELLLPVIFLFNKLSANKILTTVLLVCFWYSLGNEQPEISIFKFLNYASLFIAVYALLWLLKRLPSQRQTNV
ncbi:MAG: hypothetical protein C0459_03540 [Chitinophaga sp.]|jgi:hypothetical protein|nr:hypothetical protein [Chitinophaga sp.]